MKDRDQKNKQNELETETILEAEENNDNTFREP